MKQHFLINLESKIFMIEWFLQTAAFTIRVNAVYSLGGFTYRPSSFAFHFGIWGVVDSIIGRTGEGVHSLELWLRSGELYHHGSEGGAIQTVFQAKLTTFIEAFQKSVTIFDMFEWLAPLCLLKWSCQAALLKPSAVQVEPDELLVAVMQDLLLRGVHSSGSLFGLGTFFSPGFRSSQRFCNGCPYPKWFHAFPLLTNRATVQPEDFSLENVLGSSLVFYTSKGRILLARLNSAMGLLLHLFASKLPCAAMFFYFFPNDWAQHPVLPVLKSKRDWHK